MGFVLSGAHAAWGLSMDGATPPLVRPGPRMRVAQALVVLLSLFATSPWVRADAHFEACSARTGSNATVIVPASVIELDGAPMEVADEVAVFTPGGVCAGRLTWDGANTAMAVWEDDPSTEPTEGFVSGEPLSYVIWDASTSTEYGRGQGHVQASYAATFDDDGVFRSDAIYLVAEIAVSSEVTNESESPRVFALESNFPNPFRGRTTIQYELPEDAPVKLEIYNLLGHRVSVVADGFQTAGRYEVVVEPGSDWASGVYVYRLQAGEHATHRKMVLVN